MAARRSKLPISTTTQLSVLNINLPGSSLDADFNQQASTIEVNLNGNASISIKTFSSSMQNKMVKGPSKSHGKFMKPGDKIINTLYAPITEVTDDDLALVPAGSLALAIPDDQPESNDEESSNDESESSENEDSKGFGSQNDMHCSATNISIDSNISSNDSACSIQIFNSTLNDRGVDLQSLSVSSSATGSNVSILNVKSPLQKPVKCPPAIVNSEIKPIQRRSYLPSKSNTLVGSSRPVGSNATNNNIVKPEQKRSSLPTKVPQSTLYNRQVGTNATNSNLRSGVNKPSISSTAYSKGNYRSSAPVPNTLSKVSTLSTKPKSLQPVANTQPKVTTTSSRGKLQAGCPRTSTSVSNIQHKVTTLSSRGTLQTGCPRTKTSVANTQSRVSSYSSKYKSK